MNGTLLRFIIFILAVSGSAAIGVVAYKTIAASPKAPTLVTADKFEQMGKLVLVRITVKEVLKQVKERPFYLPNAEALLLIVGEVSAGVDLEKVKQGDISETATRVTIKLPKPEILMSKINHDQSMVYDVRGGGWSTAELVDQAYKAAEPKIIDAAKTMGYAATCESNARKILTAMFGQMSGKEILIEFKD